MEEFYESLEPWCACQGYFVASSVKINMRILLQIGSLAMPYLCFQEIENEGKLCIIPITRLITAHVSLDSILFTFMDYEDEKVLVKCEKSRKFEAFISQFRLTANISLNASDDFHQQNAVYLKANSMEKNYPLPFDFIDLHKTKYGLSPVGIFKETEEVWKERCTVLNSSYFTQSQPIVIHCLTWNVAEATPTTYATPELMKVIHSNPDVAFFSFQEIDMSVNSMVIGNSAKANQWKEVITASVKTSQLEIVHSISLGGVFGCLALNKTNPQLRLAKTKKLRLGAGGIVANKSFVQFNIEAGAANICLVGCHLTAHDHNIESRNQQLIKIMNMVPRDTDYLFICGDLNYRISMPYEKVVNLCNGSDLSSLLETDQLINQRRMVPELGKLFEPPITFRPTYKFDKNSDIYDTSPKKRVPSYTDRVLLRTFEPRISVGPNDAFFFETDVFYHYGDPRYPFSNKSYFAPTEPDHNYPVDPKNILYTNGTSKISDHRCVHSHWELMIPAENKERKEVFNSLLYKKYNELLSLEKPICIANTQKVEIKRKKSITIEIENISYTLAEFSVNTTTDKIVVTPSSGYIIPGQSIKVEIQAVHRAKGEHFILFMSPNGTLCSIQVKIKSSL
ncbi:phosphatidylinositol dephosphorylation [Trichomonas vaginalis G3]|nr:phosphatidylinositol dephosphorylation [Trichomonas vaginalis G3]KAI5488551.1 phosphatidylinositol dephosphorylation [Trichomonas vaginalis G3]